MNIGVDLDGVCYDFSAALRQYANEFVGISLDTMPEPDNWYFFRTQWGWTDQQFVEICADGVLDGFMFAVGEPMPGTVEALEYLHSRGHEIHYVTDRSFGGADICARNTMYWLDTEGLPCTSLTVAKDKTSVPVDVFIDDRVENYEALEAAGTLTFLRTQKWNLHKEGARRVTGWDEFVSAVDALSIPAAA